MTADQHAQALARAAVFGAAGFWQLATSSLVDNGHEYVGGAGLVIIAGVYLRLEHRRSKRLDERTDRLIDHLEDLAGIAHEVLAPDETTDHDDRKPPIGPPLPRGARRPGARARRD